MMVAFVLVKFWGRFYHFRELFGFFLLTLPTVRKSLPPLVINTYVLGINYKNY
jgi:hypothetical protein